MGDENPDTMNLGLNLGITHDLSGNRDPGSGSYPNTTVNLEGMLNNPIDRLREELGQRRLILQSVLRQFESSSGVITPLREGSVSQIGEGSVVVEQRLIDGMKPCDDRSQFLNDKALGKKGDEEKYTADAGSYFDCRICLDVAKDSVVTCCGHLFCWPCLYRWLNIHSVAKECPVCKGEVTIKNVTPIHGRGENDQKPEINSSLKIPLRPLARRVESWRQAFQRAAFTVPMEEMIRRLGHKFDLSQVHPHNAGATQESSERTNSLLTRILTSRGMRREQNNIISPNDAVDFIPSSPTDMEARDSLIISTLLPGSNSYQAATISHFTSVLSSAESFVEADFPSNPVDRNPEMPFPVDDRDEFLSIAADIHSESQTLESVVEIDSGVSLFTSSARRRFHTSPISNVDSGYSRPTRRRRLG